MLKTLSIRNVILIDKLDIDLQNGFTVLSGETGAGKSILLDALGLLLGRRGDVGMVREGCDKLSVCGCFEVSDRTGEIAKLFSEHELDYDHEIILKRTLSADGRGKIFCNDQPITQKLLRELGQLLVEVHGQFDNQGLLDQSTHQQVLDGYGDYGPLLKDMRTAFGVYKGALEERKSLEDKLQKAKADEDNLRHWIEEFQFIKPKVGEQAVLEQKRQQMMNAEKILENLSTAYGALNKPDHNVRDAIRQAQAAMARVNGVTNNAYEEIYTLLDTALINVEEAASEIECVSNEVNLSQKEIDDIEERLFALKDLARKHRVSIDELPHVWQKMEDQLMHLEKGESELFSLLKREKEAFEVYKNKAQIVHEERLNAARHLDAAIMRELPDLKMEKASFKTLVELKPEEVKGIVNLVSHSIQGLQPENITIVDEAGNILNENEDEDALKDQRANLQALNQIEMTRKVRDHLQNNIQTMLDHTLGEGNAFVRVSVELDFDERKTDRQTFTPVVDESGIIRSQQDISEAYNGESNIPGGPAGVEGNIPGYVAEERNANAEYERKESTKNYEINEENQKIVASPGSIRRLTVAVLVNDTVTEPQQESLLRTVSSAAGINEERGDMISVEPLPFSTELRDRRAAEEAAARERQERILYTEIGAVILLASLIIGGFLMYRRKKRQEREAAEEAVRQAELARQRAEEEARQAAIEAGRIEEEKLTPEERRQRDEKAAILKLIDEKPAEVAMLMKQWLSEDD